MTLYESDGTTVASDANGVDIAAITTLADGLYSFTNVPSGDYVVKETNPANHASVSDVDTANDDSVTASVTVTGGAVTGKDFVDAPISDISGSVQADTDNDNVADTPLAGVTVTLYEADGTTVATDANGVAIPAQTTVANGSYTFANVPAGDYVIIETNPANHASSRMLLYLTMTVSR